MSTFSQTSIKYGGDLDLVLNEIKTLISIGEEEWSEEKREWLYSSQNKCRQTIIVSKNQSLDWIELELNFDGNIYIYDEYLRRISKILGTQILVGYYQSTIGEGRLAKFNEGRLEMSFYEKCFDNSPSADRIYVADNFGVNSAKMELLRDSKFGADSNLIDHDFIDEYFKSEGWQRNSDIDRRSWKYLHLEEIK